MKIFWLTALLTVLTATLEAPAANSMADDMVTGETVSLTLANGLAGETVNRVMTDRSGYVWIATDNGVNCYNGKRLDKLTFATDEHRTVTVNDLCETHSRQIFAATDAGLFMLDLHGSVFQRMLPQVQNPISLLAVGDTVYIGSMQGFQMYAGGKLTRKDISISRMGYDNIVSQYQRDDNGLIWFIGRYSLHSYDPRTGRIADYNLLDVLPDKTGLSHFCKVGDRFFLGTHNKGLYVYDLGDHRERKLTDVGNVIMSVSVSADGYVCVATDGTGAFLIDPESLVTVRAFNTEGAGAQRLPTNAVYSYYRDDNGVNWLGFVRYGLLYGRDGGTLFQPYATDGLSTLGMNARSFCRRGSESMIGLHNGLWYVDSVRHISQFFSPDDLGGGHIVNSMAYWEGRWYVGTYDGGLRVLNPMTLTIGTVDNAPNLAESIIGDIKAGPDGRLWIGCSDGLYIFDRQGHIEHYTEMNSHIIGAIIISITFDSQGNAWLSGMNGVSLYSAASRDIVKTDFPRGFFNREPYMRGARGHDGLIYMRNGPQLFYTKEDMSDFGELTMPLTFSDKWCRSMVDDMKGHLWMTTERGLFRFDYGLNTFVHFGQAEGLLGDQLSEVSIDDEGRLWVVTSQGVFSLDANRLKHWQQDDRYKVVLFNMRRGTDLIGPDETYQINENRELRLSWSLGSEALQAEAVLLDFAPQRGRLYEYRLDDQPWRLLQDGEQIDIRGLMMGRHHLHMRLAGMEGTMTTYTITVIPSVWTVIALALLLMALLLLWLWWRYRRYTRRVISEHRLTEQALIEEIEEVKGEEVKGEESLKYQKVKVDETECADIVARMKEYIEREKIYTNADLKMKDLADVLHLSPSKLSQVFNIFLGENYYDFINRYRLNEFKRLIGAGDHKRFTITALSEQAGFKKSNFFSTFRKVEGMTPAEYLKKQGVKI